MCGGRLAVCGGHQPEARAVSSENEVVTAGVRGGAGWGAEDVCIEGGVPTGAQCEEVCSAQ